MKCKHESVVAEPCDQTMGVACDDCNEWLAYCWKENHVPESLWNRVAALDPDCEPCEQNRDNVCAFCETEFGS